MGHPASAAMLHPLIDRSISTSIRIDEVGNGTDERHFRPAGETLPLGIAIPDGCRANEAELRTAWEDGEQSGNFSQFRDLLLPPPVSGELSDAVATSCARRITYHPNVDGAAWVLGLTFPGGGLECNPVRLRKEHEPG
jgi:hypothetical protein